MRTRFFLLLLSFAALPGALVFGCNSSIETSAPGGGGGGGAGWGGGHTSSSSGSSSGGFDAGKDALPDYVDPGCPDAGPAVQSFDCDPYHQQNGDCLPGEGCYIFVSYPEEPCGQETYGSFCMPVGAGGQGDGCNGAQDCGGGFVCVVSGSGNQCVKLCQLVGSSGCPAGLVCEPIDVEGFGGCL